MLSMKSQIKFYKELLQIGLEDIDSLEEQRINEIIQKYISE